MVTSVTCQLFFQVYQTLIRCPRPSDAEQDIGKILNNTCDVKDHERSCFVHVAHVLGTSPYSLHGNSRNILWNPHYLGFLVADNSHQQSSAFPVIGSGIVRSWRDSGGARSCPSGLDIAFLIISDTTIICVIQLISFHSLRYLSFWWWEDDSYCQVALGLSAWPRPDNTASRSRI